MTENVWLWIAQGILAVAYLMAGGMKAFQPMPKLTAMMGWPGDYPRLTRFVAWAEIAGAVGLILPMLLDILPWLTPLAAIGLSLVQVAALVLHAMRGETMKTLPANLFLLGLSLFVAIGRFDLF